MLPFPAKLRYGKITADDDGLGYQVVDDDTGDEAMRLSMIKVS